MNQLIEDTLHRTAEDVPVPPIDQIALTGRVGRLRNRRRAGLAAAVAAALAVPALAAPLAWDALAGRESRSVEPALTGPAGALGTVAFAIDGILHLQAPSRAGNGSTDTGIRVEEVVAVRDDGVLVVDRQSRALLVPVDGGDPVPLLGDRPIQRVLSAEDGTLFWVDLDEQIHLQRPGTDARVAGELDPDAWLYDVSPADWLEGQGDRVHLTHGSGGVLVEASGPVVAAQAAGDTVAVTVAEGTEFADISAGESTQTGAGEKAGRTGALSDDGRWWVANPTDEETLQGMTRGLWRWDTTTGEGVEFAGFDETGAVVDVAWQDDRALVVVETHAGTSTLHTLYSCSPETLTCDYHYEDETGTLTLPTG